MHGAEDPWNVPWALQEHFGLDAIVPSGLKEAGRSALETALEPFHRSPRELSRWIHKTAVLSHAQYRDDVSWAWNRGRGVEASRLFSRLMDFVGIGPAKAMLLMYILEKDWNVRITAWDEFDPPMTESMERMARRIGWHEGDPPAGYPFPAMYEGLRSLANEFCLVKPVCGACPLESMCPKNGVE